jgi:hypothetical protein
LAGFLGLWSAIEIYLVILKNGCCVWIAKVKFVVVGKMKKGLGSQTREVGLHEARL